MELVEIHNCDYQTFSAIRREIRFKVSYALISSDYLPEDQKAYFYFWDSRYIPDELMPYRIRSPFEKEYDFSGIRLPGQANIG